MSKQPAIGKLRHLSPEELQVVKGQIGAVLNYTASGGAAAKVPHEIHAKISPEDAKKIGEEVARLLGSK